MPPGSESEPPPAPLMGDEPEPPPSEGPGGTAASHLALAQQHFAAKEYQKAAEELQLAYTLDPRPLYLFNVAQAYRRALLPKEALAMYERFLREDPNSTLRGEAEGYCNDMRVLIAEQDRGAQVKAALGEEQVRAEERQQALRVEQERAARTQKALLVERARAERERKKPVYKRGWFWGVVVSGVALVGAGIGLGVGFAPRDRSTDGGFVDINFALRAAAPR
jgi:tetratricopeptide (TPR) repeat protein